MTESFLHYIWQFQYFNKEGLKTSANEMLQIFQPGNRNADAGPDFSDARIKIENIEWRGSVEIHINASGWMDHHHGEDSAYEKVILHVVWENDKPIERTDGTLMPTLELKNRVDLELWNRYKKLYTSAEEIPCGASWPSVQEITKVSMLDKTVMQRLESKAKLVVAALNKNGNDWEETSYQLLLKNFGFKVNVEAMERLGQVLSYKVLLKHLDKPYQIEALLFGQAGLLEDVNEDDYTSLLKREFKVLQKKYTLEGKQMNAVQWRFLRLRPANFPTMRLAQAAALLVQNQNLFSKILERENPNHLMKLFAVDQSDYWKSHYQFGKQTKGQTPSLGKSSIQNIVMNTVVPMLVAYGKLHDEQLYVERAVDLLQLLPAETNKITKQWAAVGFKPRTAFDSQGLIELYNNFCMKRRCLDCNVGAYLVNKSLS